jgi:CheY-like chemotaxis protein
MIRARFRNALAAAALFLSGVAARPALAYPDPQELLNDFTHYALVGHVELATAYAQALIESGISNADLAVMLDEGKVTVKRFDDAISRAQMVPELEAVAADLARRVELGRLDLARDPKRIDQAISMLIGAQRQKKLAQDRLLAAREYAVPALLRQITEGRDEQLKLSCQTTLEQIGRPAVGPLCEALPHLAGVSQRVICDVLGTIKYPAAAPYLREVMLNEKTEGPARDAASRAFRAVGGGDSSLSTLYANLAREYFNGNESLICFPEEPHNNVWTYSNITGLSPMPVSTAIYSEVMAMRTASRALRADRANSAAVDVFVAANLKRENDLPEGEADPVYGTSPYTPEFYATVFGTQTCLNVLGMGIDRLDTPLVRDAILALSKTTGGANLFARGQGRSPLLEALTYPDRRVQYEAALTLGAALPQQPFAGDYTVVPILASAVRMGNRSLALVIADNDENRNNHVAQLEKIGFDIAAAGSSLATMHADIAKSVGIDLVVLRVRTPDEAQQAVSSMRNIPKTAAAPVVVVAGEIDRITLRNAFRDDARVNVVRAGLQDEPFSAAIEYVMKNASGGRMTDAEAEEYAIRALAGLRDIAISRNAAFRVADAESALTDALKTRTGGVRLLVADILALIDSDSAQRSLFDAALSAQEDEQIELLRRVADSVRLNGDRAEKRHVDALIALIGKSSGDTADAAATVHGALNLSTSDAVNLIPQS